MSDEYSMSQKGLEAIDRIIRESPQYKSLIKEFLDDWNRMMERIEFHTENPDSELMDEVMEEYKKWEKKLTDSGSGGEF